MDLDFIAGLIDADGNLSVSLEKNFELKFKYKRKLVFDITNKDKEVLLKVKHSLGFGMVLKTSNTKPLYAFRTNTFKDAKKIISFFETRLHGSAKIEMPLWKQALYLSTNHNTQQGFIEFVYLMYGINSKGLLRKHPISYWLDMFNGKDDVEYANIVRLNSVPSIAVNGSYVSGYCQGDGSFNLSNKKRFVTNFTLTDAERSVLDLIQEFLLPDSNCVFKFNPKTSLKNKDCYRLQIDRFKKCEKIIIPHFDSFPVFGEQKERYLLWREAVLLAKENTIESKKRISEICDSLQFLKKT